jgi:hypothetical protein
VVNDPGVVVVVSAPGVVVDCVLVVVDCVPVVVNGHVVDWHDVLGCILHVPMVSGISNV